MPEWVVQLLFVVLCVGILIWRFVRKIRWCGTCRHYSRNTFPAVCCSCKDEGHWEPINDKGEE